MAYIRKRGKSWRAEISSTGESATRKTKAEAEIWAARRESEIADKAQGRIIKRSIKQAFDEYIAKVAPRHKGHRWEVIRLKMLLDYFPVMAVGDVSTKEISDVRDARLLKVTSGSVLREMNLLSSVFESCIEWGWCRENPVKKVWKPKANRARDRVITPEEVAEMIKVFGYTETGTLNTFKKQVATMFLLALETGMRDKEIVGLEWSRIHLEKAYLRLDDTKTDVPRDVPLSRTAIALLERCKGIDDERVFLVTGQSRDAIFRTARNAGGMSGFTFHDSRHTAATRIANDWMYSGGKKGLDVLSLCKMFGWKDPKQAMVYYNPSASDIAAKLN